MKYRDIVACFEQAAYEVAQISNEHGCIATIAAGARVIALAPDAQSDSFFFNPAGINDIAALKQSLFCHDGAPGGDRLWIAPEYQYHWLSEPKDFIDYNNYQVAHAIDPSSYQMCLLDNRVEFSGDIKVLNQQTKNMSCMQVKRSITQLVSPISASGVACASYRVDQQLNVTQGVAGLWNITQLPIGSVIVFPLRQSEPPRNYFNPGDIQLDDNACAFYVGGKANAKIGYGAAAATGNSAAFYQLEGQLNMVYRHNAVIKNGYYCDGLNDHDPKDQVVQAWDGFGFGELEYHSIAAGDNAGSQAIKDISELHCLRGEQGLILEIASEFLELPIATLEELVLREPWQS